MQYEFEENKNGVEENKVEERDPRSVEKKNK